ncbi:50S ribosomal protein L15e [Candidatus Woesearchaeota archaeon]|nr:50S ribosomal protein L15e [Candidatus Woesearchaeota archaeon]
MGIYKYINKLWRNPKANMPELWKQRLVKWRRQDTTVRIERPTRLDRARNLGYKAKPGYILARQRVRRTARKRPKRRNARRTRTRTNRKVLAMTYQSIAERRANKKFPNLEVLNSYWVAEDGKFKWYEIILVDKENPCIKADKNISWISKKNNRGRAFRGKTSSGKKSRGLRNKGKGAEKVRPSLRKNKRKAH